MAYLNDEMLIPIGRNNKDQTLPGSNLPELYNKYSSSGTHYGYPLLKETPQQIEIYEDWESKFEYMSENTFQLNDGPNTIKIYDCKRYSRNFQVHSKFKQSHIKPGVYRVEELNYSNGQITSLRVKMETVKTWERNNVDLRKLTPEEIKYFEGKQLKTLKSKFVKVRGNKLNLRENPKRNLVNDVGCDEKAKEVSLGKTKQKDTRSDLDSKMNSEKKEFRGNNAEKDKDILSKTVASNHNTKNLRYEITEDNKEFIEDLIKNNKNVLEEIAQGEQFRNIKALQYDQRLLRAKIRYRKTLLSQRNMSCEERLAIGRDLVEHKAELLESQKKTLKLENDIKEKLYKNFDTHSKSFLVKAAVKEVAYQSLESAAIDAITTGLIESVEQCVEYYEGNISLEELVTSVGIRTGKSAVLGGVKGVISTGLNVASKCASCAGFKTVGEVTKKVTPGLAVAAVGYKVCTLGRGWVNGTITTGGIVREVGTTALSTGGGILAGAMIGGPLGIAAGIGINVGVSLADHFM